MKIKSIEFYKHSILGDMKIDFSKNEEVNPYESVLIVGENGCGKTTLLDIISSLFTANIEDLPSCKITCIIDKIEAKKLIITTALLSNQKVENIIANYLDIPLLSQLIIDKKSDQDFSSYILDDRGGTVSIKYQLNYSKNIDAENYFFFHTKNIRFPISNDSNFITKNKSTMCSFILNERLFLTDDFRSLIYKSDFEDIDDSDGNEEKYTFSYFKLQHFIEIYLKKINDLTLEKLTHEEVYFSKQNKIFPYANLNPGTKALLLCVAFLLSSKPKENYIVTIDEPEQSLHTNIKNTIMSICRKAIDFDDDAKHNQMFVATHSRNIIKDAMKMDALIIVLTKKGNDIIAERVDEKKKSIFASGSTLSEILFRAFEVPSIEFHNELYGYIEERKLIREYKRNSRLRTKEYIDNRSPNKRRVLNLSEYIRHQIHHPENKHNIKFSEEELKESINEMIRFIELKNI